MPTYRVHLRGRNYLLDFEGRPTRMSFTTSIVVAADGPSEAARQASLKAQSKFWSSPISVDT